MAVTLKKGVAMITLAFVLLGGLVGGFARAETATVQHHTAMSTSHQVAMNHYVVCPPPPYWCE